MIFTNNESYRLKLALMITCLIVTIVKGDNSSGLEVCLLIGHQGSHGVLLKLIHIANSVDHKIYSGKIYTKY
jgi:hypothetical protein